jgi:hypothetical protein
VHWSSFPLLSSVIPRGLDLDVSLFERLVNQQGFPVATLEQQRRMLPLISRQVLRGRHCAAVE